MIKLLKNIFETQDKKQELNTNKSLEILCGLMVEAANTDGKIEEKEIIKINSALVDIFEEEPSAVNLVLNNAINNHNESKSLHFYTSKINKEYSDEKKLLLIETLWEIVLSDGNIHDYESNLIRRLAGLLYISDVASGNAKKRALNKISKNNDIRS